MLGNAEWEDASHTGLRIILKSIESLAGDIYSWVLKNDFADTVFTVYELHSGDDNQDSGFHGVDPVLLRRALGVLEKERKVRINAPGLRFFCCRYIWCCYILSELLPLS